MLLWLWAYNSSKLTCGFIAFRVLTLKVFMLNVFLNITLVFIFVADFSNTKARAPISVERVVCLPMWWVMWFEFLVWIWVMVILHWLFFSSIDAILIDLLHLFSDRTVWSLRLTYEASAPSIWWIVPLACIWLYSSCFIPWFPMLHSRRICIKLWPRSESDIEWKARTKWLKDFGDHIFYGGEFDLSRTTLVDRWSKYF